MSMEDLIPEEDVVVTITRGGYAKRTRVDHYRSQKRGGKGVRGRPAARRRHRRALLHDDDPPLAAVLHQPGPGLPGQGLRAARGRPRRQGPARGQPAGVPAGRADRPGAGHARLRAAALPACWPPRRGLVKKTRLGGLRLQPLRRPDRDQPARAATSCVGAGLGRPADDDLLLVSRKGQSVRFTRTDETLRPMGRATSRRHRHEVPRRRPRCCR